MSLSSILSDGLMLETRRRMPGPSTQTSGGEEAALAAPTRHDRLALANENCDLAVLGG